MAVVLPAELESPAPTLANGSDAKLQNEQYVILYMMLINTRTYLDANESLNDFDASLNGSDISIFVGKVEAAFGGGSDCSFTLLLKS